MWIMGADPALMRGAGEALGRIPFLVVQDLFMTDTASLAEVVLPAASFAETDGSFTNLTGRLQARPAAKRPPGQARPDWWIIAELARRMVDDKRQRAWDFSGAGEVLSEISRVVPGYRGWTMPRWGRRVAAPAPRAAPSSGVCPGRARPGTARPRISAGSGSRTPLVRPGHAAEPRGADPDLVPAAFVMIHPRRRKLGLAMAIACRSCRPREVGIYCKSQRRGRAGGGLCAQESE